MIVTVSGLTDLSLEREEISNTQDSVSPNFQKTRSSSKVLRCASYF